MRTGVVTGKRTLLVVVVLAAAALGWAIARGEDPPPGPPVVVVVVLDEFPTESLLDRSGRIDAERYPNFARLARRATWFRNATTVYDQTPKAVPAILDGRQPTLARRASSADHPRSLYTMLGRAGYRVHDFEEVTAVCPERLCPGVHLRDGLIHDRLVRGRVQRFERFVRSLRPTSDPTLWFGHFMLPHAPYLLLPSGRRTRHSTVDPIVGLNSRAGFDDPWVVLHNWQRHFLQVGYVDRALGVLVRRMEDAGLWDRALLVVTADHGISFRAHVHSRRELRPWNMEDVLPVPLFVKAPGQQRGRVSQRWVRSIDILPTIADVLDLRPPRGVDGRSAFARASAGRRALVVPSRWFSRRYRISTAELERRRLASLRRRVRLLGDRSWSALFRAGPNADLLGRPVASLRLLRGGGPRALLRQADALRAVVPASGFVPTHLTGRLIGPGRAPGLPLALALNGRIEAVGRSFRLNGRRAITFAFLVPERALRRGANQAELFEVRGVGQRRTLVRLALD